MSYDTLVKEVAEKADRALHDRPDFNLDQLKDYDQMKEKLSMEVVFLSVTPISWRRFHTKT